MNSVLDIHIILKDKKYIAFHPESFSLFYVNDEIGRILRYYELKTKDINIIAETFKIQVKYIENILENISEEVTPNYAKNIELPNEGPISLNLLISQDCNLRCRYCYADHGTYGCDKKLMDFDVAKSSIDKLLNKNHNNYIVFFGGEPFLNFALMKKIEGYLTKKGINTKYTSVTNGTIMNTEIKNFIDKNFFKLCISLDGTKEINDVQRYGDIKSVHDRVVATINELMPRNYPLSIKAIATKNSVNMLADVDEYISSLYIDSMAIAPVQSVPFNNELSLSDEDYKIFIRELAKIHIKKIREMAKGNRVVFLAHILEILRLIATKTRKICMCSAGRESVTITADGDVYPCQLYIGMEMFNMGNVYDDDFPGDKFKKVREMLYNINVYKSPACSTCWARFLCGGDCHYLSYITNKNLSIPRNQRCLEVKSMIDALLPEIAEIFQDEIKTKNLLKCLSSRSRTMSHDIC